MAHLSSTSAVALFGASSRSWTHTIEAGAKRIVVRVGGILPLTGMTATCNGTSMTKIGESVSGAASFNIHAIVFSLDNPPTGAQTIEVNSGGPTNWAGVANSSTYDALGAFGTPSTGTGTSNTSTRTVSSAVGSIVLDAIAWQSGTLSSNSGTTRLTFTADVGYVGAGQDTDGASSVNMTWTAATSDIYAHIAVSMAQDTGPPPPAPAGLGSIGAGAVGYGSIGYTLLPPITSGGGTSFIITPSGGIIFSGTVSFLKGRQINPTGNIVFSGTQNLIKSKVFLPTGGITFSGTVTPLRGKVITPTGNITFTGTVNISRGKQINPLGSITFSGDVPLIKSNVLQPTGNITFSGNAPITFSTAGGTSFTINPTGGITFTGTVPFEHSKVYIPSGGIEFSGTNLTTHSKIVLPTGAINFTGTSPITFTPSGGGGGGTTTKLPLTSAGKT